MILGETNINPTMYQSGYKVDWDQLEKATAKISNYPILHIHKRLLHSLYSF